MKSLRFTNLLLILAIGGCASQGPYLHTSDLIAACSADRMGSPSEGGYIEPALYAACYTYLAASVDALYADAEQKSGEMLLPEVCMPKRPGISKAKDIFIEYLRDNPHRADALSDDTPYLAVVEALSREYPCTDEVTSVFNDVAALKGSLNEMDSVRKVCTIEEIEGWDRLYTKSDRSDEYLLSRVFYLNPGLRKLKIRCEMTRENAGDIGISAFISFMAEQSSTYQPVYLQNQDDPEKYCIYMRNIDTSGLVASACP